MVTTKSTEEKVSSKNQIPHIPWLHERPLAPIVCRDEHRDGRVRQLNDPRCHPPAVGAAVLKEAGGGRGRVGVEGGEGGSTVAVVAGGRGGGGGGGAEGGKTGELNFVSMGKPSEEGGRMQLEH